LAVSQVSEAEEVSERKAICGSIIHPTMQKPLEPRARRVLGLKRIRCTEELGHEGNHGAQTRKATAEWRSQEKVRL
jgi:hypothetical protein